MRSRTHLLRAVARRHYWAGAERLSVKTFRGGAAFYDIGAGRHRVADDGYLVVNEDQRYAITVDAHTAIESFCVFLERGLAAEVHRALTDRTERLLDDPSRDGEPIRFVERVYPHDDLVTPIVERMRRAPRERVADDGWIGEQARALVTALLAVHRGERGRARALPAVRASTQEELYRRLHRARDYALAALGDRLALDDLARVACLSPSHFLRTFRGAFGVTPHQFVTAARLNAARRLLTATETPVTDICLSVGFESLGSFSWLFRRRFGMSPAAYRRAARKSAFWRSRAAAPFGKIGA